MAHSTLRRNIRHKPTKSESPYNELYEAFKSFYAPIFSERLGEGLRSQTYVPVPETEEDVSTYLESDVSGIAVLSGLMGSGKSTILEHYQDEFRNSPNKVFVYLNFAGRRYHFLPPEDFVRMDSDERRVFARSIVTRRINELLLPVLKAHRDLIDVDFFNFLEANYISEIGAEALFAKNNDEKIRIVQDFMKSPDQTAPIQCFLRYLGHLKKIESFIIVVDNVDEQPFEIVEGLFYVLTDFIECMMRRRRPFDQNVSLDSDPYGVTTKENDNVYPTTFKAILACRNHTFDALKTDEGGIYQTRGCTDIILRSGEILTSILEKRINFFRTLLQQKKKQNPNTAVGQDKPYTLRSGVQVKLENAFDFLESFVIQLSERSVESPLFSLFNNNYGRAIKNIKYVIQNRYFLLFDQEVMSSGDVQLDFHYTSIVKAIGYGNPKSEDDLFFPAQSSSISNILWWEPGRPNSLFSIIKFLKWIDNSGFASDYGDGMSVDGCTISFAIDALEHVFGFSEELSRWVISYCHHNGLVFAASGYSSSLSDYETISISPKGRMHIQEFFRSMVFFEMFVDDLYPMTEAYELVSGRLRVPRVGVQPTSGRNLTFGAHAGRR